MQMHPNGGVQLYNQKFLDLEQHIETFITNRARRHPSIWYDRIPKGSYSYFEGLTRESNIFHGSLGAQAGLKGWRKIQTSVKPKAGQAGYDACNYDPQTFGYAVESVSYSGYGCSWQSEPICLNDIRFLEQGRQQAQYAMSSTAYVTTSVWETWNREQYVLQAVKNGNAVIITEGGLDFMDDPDVRFSYDPFAEDGDSGESYISFPDTLAVSSLSWDFFEWFQDYLGDECPEASLANDGGLPIFGIFAHKRDIAKAIKQDPELRETYRYAMAKALLDDYRSVVFDMFDGWLFMHDSRQMRFKEHRREGGRIVARRVKPFREGREAAIGHVPEANPEYLNAEYAIGVIFMKDVVQNLIPGVLNNLGDGMVFGPAPGYEGTFRWINEYDRRLNPLNEVGFFFARFEAFPKPLMYSNRAVAFLYKRCVNIRTKTCDIGEDVAAVSADVAIAVSAAAGDVDDATKTITLRLAQKLACQSGPVTFTLPNGATSATAAVIGSSGAAPVYTFMFAPGSTIAYADFTTAATVSCGT